MELIVRTDPLICIVDDDEEVRASIGSFFRAAGLAVRKFEAAEALLAWADLPSMACLITDLHMPGMNGLELQAALRERGYTVPVILMTAFPTAEARAIAERQGICAFITKPTDPEALLEKVETLLG